MIEDIRKSRFKTNVAQRNKFSEMLASIIRRYQNRSIETAQVIEELIAMAKQFKAAAGRDTALGLNPDELAFYDALASDEVSVRELNDEVLKRIAQELAASLRRSVTVDWSVRGSVRARLRILVRNILKKYKYPPVRRDEAIQLVLQQAETLSDAWTT